MHRPHDLGEIDLATEGVALGVLEEHRAVAGTAGGEAVVAGQDDDGGYWAIGGTCTHYGGPLGQGIFDGREVRCPWHHARFHVANGSAAAAPAFDGVDRYETSVRDGRLFVGAKREPTAAGSPPREPSSIVVVGGGAAGYAAIEQLRRLGYGGPLTMVTEDPAFPYDRPNLSKDYLAGHAPEEWIPLRSDDFYVERNVDVRRGVRADRIDLEQRAVVLDGGERLPYEALLLATGSNPIVLNLERDADAAPVCYLRTRADADRIIELAANASSAAVIGASFIGTEVAASLRERGLAVTVIDQAPVPLGHVLGDELGQLVRAVHEEHGVTFRLGQTVQRIGRDAVVLDDGSSVPAELVVVGVGVRPNTQLAEEAGLAVDRGVTVDEYLRASAPRVWAAGDIASWPDARSEEPIRVEHWVVAERQGQVAARNILGLNERFDEVPFFWSAHYDMTISYVGHAARWDDARWSGDVAAREGFVSYRSGGRVMAVATVGRDETSLRAEIAMRTGDDRALDEVLAG